MSDIHVQNFEEEIIKNPKPVVVDFYADWCGPCKMFAPIFERTKEKFSENIEFKKVDVEKMADEASTYGVMSIPTIVIFKGGEEVTRHTGFMSEPDFVRWLEEHA